MIKPFTIISTRPEADGGNSVFFSVTKTEMFEDKKVRTQMMKTSVHVPAGEDQDQYIFDMLQKGGWL